MGRSDCRRKKGWIFDTYLTTEENYKNIILPQIFFESLVTVYKQDNPFLGLQETDSYPFEIKKIPTPYFKFALGSIVTYRAICEMAGMREQAVKLYDGFDLTSAAYYRHIRQCVQNAFGIDIFESVTEATLTYQAGNQSTYAVPVYKRENVIRLANTFQFNKNLTVNGIPLKNLYSIFLKDTVREKVRQTHTFLSKKDRFPEFLAILSMNDQNLPQNPDPETHSGDAFDRNPIWILYDHISKENLFQVNKSERDLDIKLLTFLIRRNADGTLRIFLVKLNEIMDAYDPEFAAGNRFNNLK